MYGQCCPAKSSSSYDKPFSGEKEQNVKQVFNNNNKKKQLTSLHMNSRHTYMVDFKPLLFQVIEFSHVQLGVVLLHG